MSADAAMGQGRQCLIMAGGTGGHVFPALAVAADLRARGWRIAWLGSGAGIEQRLVPAAGYPLFSITVSGLRGKGWTTLLLAPWRLAIALAQAAVVLAKVRPRVVLGMGGFASGPGGLAAWLAGKPLLIHEQNAIPGFTNRILSRLAKRILCAFPNSFDERTPTQWVGNPVRTDIQAIAAPETRLKDRVGALRLLVLGGSQGARALNRMTGSALKALPRDVAVSVWHQCGRGGETDTHEAYAGATVEVTVEPFIDDMATAYAWSDLVLCRAGAMTISELSTAGCAAILVPFPHAVDDHQSANAQYLGQAGAARLIQEADLDPRVLARELTVLGRDRALITRMAGKARALARPHAAAAVATVCEELADGR